MKESIYIANLGPIKEIFIDEIRPFTILIGESGSGKSTLMKVIALFRWLYKMHNIRSYLKHSNMTKSPFRFRMETYFKNCGIEQFITKDTDIRYSTTFNNTKKYELSYKSGKLFGAGELIDIADIYFNKISFISEMRNIIPLWAEKGASAKGANLGFYFHEVYNDFELASEKIKDMDLHFMNIDFSTKKTRLGNRYIIKSSNDDLFEIDYKNSSSGTINTVPIMLITRYFSDKDYFSFKDAFNRSVFGFLKETDSVTDFKPIKNLSEIQKKVFIHIEEPELSLYPDAQCQLINEMVSTCFINKTNTVELFLSTHSPYIINYLNLLIKAFDKKKPINGTALDYGNISVYQIINGSIRDLKPKNTHLVNTNILSDPINRIYDDYAEMDK
jgi:predicted ATPase